ncbi:MAG TPA: tripartite tricarboxylate transporter substrate binding protein [Ramlibacter sp.]|nr:tripartite tricarboxylate transporter substrate binding protein [Ramlibacter sp.]
MPFKRTLLAAFCFASASTLAAASSDFPEKAVKIVVSTSPGSAADILARIISTPLQAKWGQPVIVDNKPGAAGGVAASFAGSQPADGHTLFIGSAGIFAIAPRLFDNLSYSPEQFVPLVHIGSLPNVFVVARSANVKSINELVALARRTPQGLSYASLGPGSTSETSVDLFVRQSGLNAVSIPYKGEPIGMTDMIGGQVHFMAAAMPVVLPQIKAGAVVPLAVTSSARSPLLPDVPTMAELGFKNFDVTQWYGLFAPAKTPSAVTARIVSAAKDVLSKEEVRKQILQQSIEPTSAAQQDFPKFYQAERASWASFVQGSKQSKN